MEGEEHSPSCRPLPSLSYISCPSLPSLFFPALSSNLFKYTMVIYLYLILKVPSTLPSLPLGLGLEWSKWEVHSLWGRPAPGPAPPHYLSPSTNSSGRDWRFV